MKTTMRGATAAVGLSVAVGFPLSAQSGADIVHRMLTEYESRAEGVENYTLVQVTMGVETVSYFEKELVNGRPVFKLKETAAGGMQVDGSGNGAGELYLMGDELTERAEYGGRDQVDGFDVHVLDIDDLTDMGFEENVGQGSDFAPTSGRIFLDVDTYAPRRLEFAGLMTNEQGEHEVRSTVVMGDYREVSGMLIAYSTVISVEGLGAAIDPEMRAQFEQMQRELENMPPEQRQMVESMMAGQLEQFRAMMEGGDAPMVVEVTVSEVRVNQGAPGR